MKTSFSKAINQALSYSLDKDKNLVCFGLGVTDPKGIFGTTLGLEKKFGSKRVFDVPTSENALTGISVGLALNKIRSVVTHQRLDFFLLAMDQLINNAAKYYYMFGSQTPIPITIRLIIGRGWGQGPTHSQSLQSVFAHIPGIKVVMPTFANDAKNLLISSIFDPNPVLFLEHRWLHQNESFIEKKVVVEKNVKAKRITKGKDLTLISMSYGTIESMKAINFLQQYKKLKIEVIDLRSIKPIDWSTIFKSVKKNRKNISC